jgi:hypothetical protein
MTTCRAFILATVLGPVALAAAALSGEAFRLPGGANIQAPTGTAPRSALSESDSVFGIFDGRMPCAPVVTEFTGFPSQGCEKVKWTLTLHRDPVTGRPSTYVSRGTRATRQGSWRIERPGGAASGRVLYRLAYGTPEKTLTLLAVEDNVLLLLDKDLKVMVGDASWSYVLNRTGPPR